MKPELFLIEGSVSHLQVGADTINLLASYRGWGNTTAGVVGAVTDQFGTAANAAMVANYEGEDADRFVCFVGDQLVEGVFSRVMFSDGDLVKAVVEKQDSKTGALVAHAVLRPSDGLLSMPYGTGRGVWAELKKNVRWGMGMFGVGLCFVSVFLMVEGWSWSFFAFAALCGGVLCLILALWAYFSESEGEISTAIFQVLGFPDPKSLNLKPSSICPNEGYLHEHSIFRYRRVIKAEDDPHGSPEPEPLKPYGQALAERQKV